MSSKIVGHKFIRYLTKHQRATRAWMIVHHQVTMELHATKGWRVISREQKVHMVKKLPTRRQWLAAFMTVFRWAFKKPPDNAKWARRDFFAGRWEMDLRAQMRHRERRRDIQLMENRERAQLA